MVLNEPDSTSHGKLKSTRTVNECSPNTGLTFSDTEIFAQLIGEPSNPSISCAEASLVRTSALPEKALDSLENGAGSGSSMPTRSKSSSRATSLSKMSAPFALADWIECSGRSLRSGMMRNGIVYPLAPWAPLTGEIGSGLWPTPVAQEGGQGVNPTARGRKLHIEVLKWPTPQARDHKDTGANVNWAKVKAKCKLAGAAGGSLNPMWVEWLMGYPQNWTSLED